MVRGLKFKVQSSKLALCPMMLAFQPLIFLNASHLPVANSTTAETAITTIKMKKEMISTKMLPMDLRMRPIIISGLMVDLFCLS